jgi:hypothetical protein
LDTLSVEVGGDRRRTLDMLCLVSVVEGNAFEECAAAGLEEEDKILPTTKRDTVSGGI